MPTWSISWKACRSASARGRLPLTAISGLPARLAVAMPVSELVWPGPPVTERERGPAMNPRPGVGGVRDARFVPHIDDAQAGARGGGEHFVEMIAHQREDGIDSQVCGGLHEEFRSVWHRTAMLLQSSVTPRK